MSYFWKGVNSDLAKTTVGVGMHTYCIVDFSDLKPEEEDCGINSYLSDFKSRYNIQSFDVLIRSVETDNIAVIMKLRKYIVSREREDVIFPSFIVRQNKKLPDGIDISVYAREVETQRQRNSLDAGFMDDMLERLDKVIIPERTVIQDLMESRTRDVKLLSLYLAMKYGLPPIYLTSFLSEYTQYQFFYPLEKLSLYERIMFLYRMPKVVGYLGINQSFNCYATVTKKLYPSPHYVFDLSTKTLLSDKDVEEGNFIIDTGGFVFADYRTMFPLSRVPINYGTSQGLSAGSDVDRQADKKLVDLFSALSELVTDEPVYLSVKNTLLADRQGKKYLFYCPEECGVQVTLMSEQFGAYEMVISECNFKQILDAQIERAILCKDRADASVSKSTGTTAEGSNALVASWRQLDKSVALQPALPLEVSLYMHMLPVHQNGLSYYDRCLRCHTDILPIITSTDSTLSVVSPLFSELALSDLRKDMESRYAINCFGTIADYREQNTILPITLQAFRQRRLL